MDSATTQTAREWLEAEQLTREAEMPDWGVEAAVDRYYPGGISAFETDSQAWEDADDE